MTDRQIIDMATVACKSTFAPLSQGSGAGWITLSEIHAVPADKRELLARYDQLCFRSAYETHNPQTFPLLKTYLGVMGVTREGHYLPFCTLYRQSPAKVTVPMHCWCEGVEDSSTRVRFFSAPGASIQVAGPPLSYMRTVCPVRSDLDDVVELTLLANPPPIFQGSPTDFEGTVPVTVSIAVFGFDAFRFQSLPIESDDSQWVKAIVYSPVRGSQREPTESLHPPPTPEAFAVCLYYDAPTFQGMSGALILGLESDQPKAHMFVAGMHLRSGAGGQLGCGHYDQVNIGITSAYIVQRLALSR